MFELLDAQRQSAVIKVIGVGGGGGNAVAHMVMPVSKESISSVRIRTRKHSVVLGFGPHCKLAAT